MSDITTTQGEVTREDIERQADGVASQSTLVEQSRAIAAVQGALTIAAKKPRDQIRSAERAREAFTSLAMAERSFFKFRRAGSEVSGTTIHFTTELARCWGNIEYGISELDRDEAQGRSEMMAYAWDLETNLRVVSTFIVPHTLYTSTKRRELEDARSIYENNANAGARRLRECIARCIPVALREECEEIAHNTLREGGGVSIEKRRASALEAFAEMGVTREQVEEKMSCKADNLSAYDLANLRILLRSIKRGETTVEMEFKRPSKELEEIKQSMGIK